MEVSRWQKEYDALPKWARELVDGLREFRAYGHCNRCQGVPGKDKISDLCREWRF